VLIVNVIYCEYKWWIKLHICCS